jgi:wyosine [tRNA(Phe)-imidazoG37] synthetase (radical SAM superfamily)
MDRSLVLARLRAITSASGRAYVALSNGDTETYLEELARIEQLMVDIDTENQTDQKIIRKPTNDETS